MNDKFEKMDKEMAKRSELEKELSCTTPEAFTEWLIACKGVREGERENVLSNLRDAFKKERVKGSLMPQAIDVEILIFGIKLARIKSVVGPRG